MHCSVGAHLDCCRRRRCPCRFGDADGARRRAGDAGARTVRAPRRRGGAAAFPENTVPPIAAAARKGAAKFGGDLARRDEIETVLRKSFLAVPNASNQFWVVAGDYNSISPVDGRMYDVPSDSPRYAVHRGSDALAASNCLLDQ